MDAFLPGWSPELERSFKEILFRFLEHVHCTKAALYLLSPDGSYQLATQYGFGRRDALTVRFEDSAPIVRRARGLRVNPRAINHRDEFPEFAEALSGAGSTRMLLVPIYGGSRLAGFVDARDKGKKRPFEANDLNTAAGISREMLQLVQTTGIVGEIEVDEHEFLPVKEPKKPVAAVQVAAANVPLLDRAGLDRMICDLELVINGEPEIAIIALSIISGAEVGSRVLVAGGAENDDIEPVFFHQADALRAIRIEPPPPADWKVHLVPDCRPKTTGPAVFGGQAIATAVVLADGPWAVVLSVVGSVESQRIARVFAHLERSIRSVSAEAQVKTARRRLAHHILDTDDDRFHLLEQHSRAVSRLAWMMAIKLQLGSEAADNAAVTGLIHDIGMKDLDYDKLYRHPSPGPAERRSYRRHPELGESQVASIGLGPLAPSVRSHHERWDGKGYPDGLVGADIPIMARIVHVAEVYDVLTSQSSYRNAVTRERAEAILRAESGKQFDPDVVEALLQVV